MDEQHPQDCLCFACLVAKGKQMMQGSQQAKPGTTPAPPVEPPVEEAPQPYESHRRLRVEGR